MKKFFGKAVAAVLAAVTFGQLSARQLTSLTELVIGGSYTVTVREAATNAYLTLSTEQDASKKTYIDRTGDASKAARFVVTRVRAESGVEYFNFALAPRPTDALAKIPSLAIFNGGGRARIWDNNKAEFTHLALEATATAGQFRIGKYNHGGGSEAYLMLDSNYANRLISTADLNVASSFIIEIQ